MLNFSYQDTQVSADALRGHEEQLRPYLERIKQGESEAGELDYPAFVETPKDERALEDVHEVAKELKRGGALRVVVVVGIGGSNLGTKAVYKALGLDQSNRAPELLFVDTISAQNLEYVLEQLSEASKPEEFAVVVASKSGTTTETIASASILHERLTQAFDDVALRFACITDEGSPLWELAGIESFHRLAIPATLGGRYSVFSTVGLLPLELAGADIEALLAGASEMNERCLASGLKNPALASAAVIFEHYQHGRSEHNLFVFDPRLASVGDWWRQLIAESLGKEYDTSGGKIEAGIQPIVSVGSTDLHSVGQLYLGGPKDKMLTTFITTTQQTHTRVPVESSFAELVPAIDGKTYDELMGAIFGGVKTAYQNRALPFLELGLGEISEKKVGALLQMKMFETVFLAKLMNVNAFDQPNVEEYKAQTRSLLGADEWRNTGE